MPTLQLVIAGETPADGMTISWDEALTPRRGCA